MTPSKVDWKTNKWFGEFYADELTNEFKNYWLNTNNVPHEELMVTEDYWVRCAFCWIGWKGHAMSKFKKKVKHEKKSKKH